MQTYINSCHAQIMMMHDFVALLKHNKTLDPEIISDDKDKP